MMTWNYRVFREENGDYVIREVFYDKDDCIIGCADNSVELVGRSVEELARNIEWLKEAVELPALTFADIPCESKSRFEEGKGNNVSHERLLAELGLSQ